MSGERAIFKTYFAGFALAVLLTGVPFVLVATHALAPSATLVAIAVFAVLQVFVHLHYFLQLNLSTSPRENLLALGFATLLILIMIGGSLWIMLDLHQRMMPA